MAETRYSFANLGSGSAGSSTVGYALYNFDGSFSVHTARSTTVTEIGSSTGIWGASFSVDENVNLLILWDTGGASPLYSWNESLSNANKISKTNDEVRLIKNTIRNQADFAAEVMNRITGFGDRLVENTGHAETLEMTLKEGLKGLPGINEKLTFMEKQLALGQPVKSNTPAIDMSSNFKEIDSRIVSLGSNFSKFMNKIDEFNSKFESIDKNFNGVKSSLGTITRLGTETKRLKSIEGSFAGFVNQFNSTMDKLAGFLSAGFNNLANQQTNSEGLLVNVANKIENPVDGDFNTHVRNLNQKINDFEAAAKQIDDLYRKIFTLNEEMKLVMTETKKNNIRQLAPYLMSGISRRKKVG